MSSTLRGPYRSTSSPTGTCIPAYTSSCSIVNVASCAALMPNRSEAAMPATAREERWKTASTYTDSATSQTRRARPRSSATGRVLTRRFSSAPGSPIARGAGVTGAVGVLNAAMDLRDPDPRDPAIKGSFVEHLGLELVEMSGDRVVATWEALPKLHQPYGIVHGGVHCSVVETLASIAGALWLGDRGQVVGVNNNTDFFRAVTDGGLTSTATPLHRGRSQQLWVVETVTDADGRLAARGQVRLQNLYPRG